MSYETEMGRDPARRYFNDPGCSDCNKPQCLDSIGFVDGEASIHCLPVYEYGGKCYIEIDKTEINVTDTCVDDSVDSLTGCNGQMLTCPLTGEPLQFAA